MTEVGLTPGTSTSEYKLTKYIFIAGTVLTAVGAVFEALATLGIGTHFVGAVLAGLGVLMTVLRAAGYENSRVALKATAIESVNHKNHLEAQTIQTLPQALKTLDEVTARLETERIAREQTEMALDLGKL